MLLVDAVYINNGGGKVLLDLLIEQLVKEDEEIFYLLDERVKGEYTYLDACRSLYISNSFIRRFDFYKESGSKFSRILTFGNVPPPIKLDAQVFTYFHNVLYLNPVLGFSLANLLLRIKILIIKCFSKNTNVWLVQSNVMKSKLAHCFKIDSKDVMVYPIFREAFSIERKSEYVTSGEIRYLYVSDGHAYKNHYNLISAFVESSKYSKSKKSLTLTISGKYGILCGIIENLRNQGFSIKNRGIISKDDLALEYRNADVAVYPSLSESFGLGLIEAAQYQLPVIAADLSYVHEVIKPSVVFNPNSVDDIRRALIETEKFLGNPAKLKIENGLHNMIKIIIKNNESNLH
jgi:glycosyltransferase involved in cell wall biosynthesis